MTRLTGLIDTVGQNVPINVDQISNNLINHLQTTSLGIIFSLFLVVSG